MNNDFKELEDLVVKELKLMGKDIENGEDGRFSNIDSLCFSLGFTKAVAQRQRLKNYILAEAEKLNPELVAKIRRELHQCQFINEGYVLLKWVDDLTFRMLALIHRNDKNTLLHEQNKFIAYGFDLNYLEQFSSAINSTTIPTLTTNELDNVEFIVNEILNTDNGFTNGLPLIHFYKIRSAVNEFKGIIKVEKSAVEVVRCQDLLLLDVMNIVKSQNFDNVEFSDDDRIKLGIILRIKAYPLFENKFSLLDGVNFIKEYGINLKTFNLKEHVNLMRHEIKKGDESIPAIIIVMALHGLWEGGIFENYTLSEIQEIEEQFQVHHDQLENEIPATIRIIKICHADSGKNYHLSKNDVLFIKNRQDEIKQLNQLLKSKFS